MKIFRVATQAVSIQLEKQFFLFTLTTYSEKDTHNNALTSVLSTQVSISTTIIYARLWQLTTYFQNVSNCRIRYSAHHYSSDFGEGMMLSSSSSLSVMKIK